MTELLAGYPAPAGDEAVDPSGRLRDGYAVLGPLLDHWGADGLMAAATNLATERRARGVELGGWADGQFRVRPFVLDPVPRVVRVDVWNRLAAGVEQRHRAFNAFLSDAYRAAGRRRSDPDRAPEIVRAGVVPEWAVVSHPGRNPDAVGLAWPGQPRVTLAASDLLCAADGRWMVAGDDLRAPWGLGYALANRENARSAVPSLFPDGGARIVDPGEAVPALAAALAEAAPPGCAGTPRIAVLSAGENDGSWFEHRMLADALGVPLVRVADLWPRADGGVEAAVGGQRVAVDVLYRRFGDAELGAHRTPIGQPLDVLLAEAVRAGLLGLANVPGNALADDVATQPYVPAMIRFYLGEEPLLDSARTWVLADEAQWAEVRGRLHELVVKPVDAYGGSGAMVGPALSAAQVAQMQAEVAAAPYRFVAQEPVDASTVPTVVDGGLQPRPVSLRVFSVAAPRVRALPAPLTRVALGQRRDPHRGGGTKDTWLLG